MRNVATRLLGAIHGVAAAALGCAAVVAVSAPWHPGGTAALTAVFLVAMIMLARTFPFHLTPKTKTAFSTVPLFAAVLLLSVPLAMAVSAAGALLGERFRRGPWFQAEFNVAETVLRVVAGTAVLALTAGPRPLASGGWEGRPAAIALTAAAMYLVNTCLLELVVAVQLRHFSAAQFLRRRRGDAVLETMLFALGAFVAVIGAASPWALALVGVAGALVYWILRRRALQPVSVGQSVRLGGK